MHWSVRYGLGEWILTDRRRILLCPEEHGRISTRQAYSMLPYPDNQVQIQQNYCCEITPAASRLTRVLVKSCHMS